MNSDILKIILAVILPPIGVLLERGCGADLLINILLTVLGMSHLCPHPGRGSGLLSDRTIGYIPGIIHALYIILKY